MCGIAGILDYSSHSDFTRTITFMLSRITHRGPEESGIFKGDHIIFGHNRLSIIDLQSGGQPMSDFTGRYFITFNGEIFNYIELRDELIKKGCKFRTQSDTEVLLNAYAVFGPACLQKLNGQFAFAIWDTVENQLFLARDRVGICPLFYSRPNGHFVFASEIKALLEHPQIHSRLSVNALSQVFTLWTTISPNTVFEDIYEVPPGHYLFVSKNNFKLEKYWELSFSVSAFKGSINEAKEEFESIFTDAVSIRLRADVPVAAYLSGGLDSSATTAFIKKVQPRVLNTFSIGFSDSDYDETGFQLETSAFLNTKHSSLKCSNADIAAIFPEVVWHSETLLLRTSPAPMYALSRFVRNNQIKVVITGEGSDEMLAGYDIFKEAVIRNFWSKYPDSKIRPLLLKKLYPYIPQIRNANVQVLKLFFGYRLSETNSPFYSHMLRWNNARHILKYLSSDIKETIINYDPVSEFIQYLPKELNSWSVLAKSQYIETRQFMSGYLLAAQGDRMTMANSVEGRYPFLDHRIIEFCAALPDEYKLHGLNEKFLLKKVVENKIPQTVLKRPKQAYRAPIGKSFLGINNIPYVHELTKPESIIKTNLFDGAAVNQLIKKVSTNGSTELEDMAIAAILSTQLWYNLFIDNKKPPLTKINPIIYEAKEEEPARLPSEITAYPVGGSKLNI